jgi:ribosomal protein S18 acetylase RimI-like enzyme
MREQPSPPDIIERARADDLPEIRRMLHEYAAWIGEDLSFQGFARELDRLPGDYAPPDGDLLIARRSGTAVGMIALRRLDSSRCEMKRLYVRPGARGGGLGRSLASRIIDEARARGYTEIVLDTLPVMTRAQEMYVALGFRDIEPYYQSSIAGTRYMALTLALDRSGGPR